MMDRIFLARAGGGGSSSGGGDGGEGGSSGYSGSSDNYSYGDGDYSSSDTSGGWGVIVIILAVFVWAWIKRKKKARVIQQATQDPQWSELRRRVEEVFSKFQDAWSRQNIEGMRPLLTEEYLKRMVLELNVLRNLKRVNQMNDVQLIDVQPTSGAIYDQKNVVQISARAEDLLIDTETKAELHRDTSSFVEYWHFLKENGVWKLDIITQKTMDPRVVESGISAFAKKHGFYFDPDFGWLMIPDKGFIFHKTHFGTSDINNHVVGYFREKIVEFYTYIPDPRNRQPTNYLVAQAILPISYKNILIQRKKEWFQSRPRGLRRITLESPDFNEHFSLWAHPEDQVSSFELLSPNFMERIHNLPFTLNIEIVGNVLYFYTKDRGAATYEHMLEILSWAFDTMKM